MKRYTGGQIVTEFIKRLRELSFLEISNSKISRNVFKLLGKSEFLIYVKGRAEEPHKWGITKNVVDRLNNQETTWFVVLLFDRPDTGYLLSQDDVNYYIRNIWPLGADGDYKPATGSYLSKNAPFQSFNMFIKQVGA